jgi:hypothetical protein
MLDLTKIAHQMQGASHYLTQESAAAQQRLARAQTLLGQAQARQVELQALQHQWRDRLGFAAATPLEPLSTAVSIAAAPALHTVLATDGSQIAPSHHEIAYCYLINVGRVVLHYGQGLAPILDSLPEVFYLPEDLYIARQWGIRTEEWMGYRRTVLEATVLAELATAVHATQHQRVRSLVPSIETHEPLSAVPLPCPTLAMVDGSLIHWFLEPLPTAARDRILPGILAAWEQLRAVGIPLVGYLSAARSSEALNFLRLQACPFAAPDCATHCPQQTERTPCRVFEPLRDTVLWSGLLQPGQRGTVWQSSARILDLYGRQRIYFCYVHVGTEIARLEFPSWVAEDSHLLEQALSLTLTQVQKGYGYPIALAEAHNQAVVRGGDRARFFALLEQHLIRAGLQNVGVSYKEARKRGSIA